MTVVPKIKRTRADMLRSVRYMLNTDPTGASADNWETDRLCEALNRSQSWVQMKMLRLGEGWNTKEFVFLCDGGFAYPLPDDFLRESLFERQVNGAEGIVYQPVPLIPLQQQYQFQQGNFPSPLNDLSREIWYIQDTKIKVRSRSGPTGNSRLNYVYRVPDLQQDSQFCELPPEYHALCEVHTAFDEADNAGDAVKADRLRNREIDLLVTMQDEASLRALSTTYRVQDALGLDDW